MTTLSSSFKVFVKKLIFFTLILTILGIAVWLGVPLKFKTPALPYLLGFYFLTTLSVHYFLLRAISKRIVAFINAFLISTTLKLFLYFGVLAWYVFTHKADALAFSITFLVLYLAFTLFEVSALLKSSNS